MPTILSSLYGITCIDWGWYTSQITSVWLSRNYFNAAILRADIFG